MIEIVFNDSAWGSLQNAQNDGHGKYSDIYGLSLTLKPQAFPKLPSGTKTCIKVSKL